MNELIRHPKDVVRIKYWMLPFNIDFVENEYFIVLMLNRNNLFKKAVVLSIGTPKRVSYNIKDIFSQAKLYRAERIITIHNHPTSGLVLPSPKDLELPNYIYEICSARGILALDAIILGKNNNYYYNWEQKQLKSKYPSQFYT